MTTIADAAALRTRFEDAGEGHVFAFWDDLSVPERDMLVSDLAAIRVESLPEQRKLVASDTADHAEYSTIEPPCVVPRDAVTGSQRDAGAALIAEGRVAPFTVAGGQGTRLGFDGPKGSFRISPVRDKPLFQLFAESILATERRYRCELTWYIMTSPINHADTVAFFRGNRFFGLDDDRVRFFQQGVMPSFSPDGRILLAERHRVALSPDGHGGSLLALAETGTLADMAARGIEHISYFQVDNPLVHCLDPAFIGLHATTDSEMSSKAVSKADDRERVGNFVMADGKLRVIEYSDLPDGLATARDAGGHRTYDAGSIAIHVISRAFIERLTADRRRFGLPWHRANKKVPCIDVETGHLVAPAEPNAVKLEAFIFDALPLANNPVVLETAREEEFSPVKNATGVDSVETARRDMSRRAAAWIERAGGDVPRDANGSPQYTYEISSLAALDSDQLAERTPLRLTPDAQGRVYIDGLP